MIYTKDNPKLVENAFYFEGIKTFTGFVKDKNIFCHYFNGKRHRTDGPAIEYIHSPRKEWYLNNERHRENGPAIDSIDVQEWYIHGKLHREDGPAMEFSNGVKGWYLNGENYGWNNRFTNESWIEFVKLELLK